MAAWLAFLIIMSIALIIGGISSGIYVAVKKSQQNKDPKSKPQPTNIAMTVSFIMVLSFLVGLLVFAFYYIFTTQKPECPPPPPCPNCLFTEKDFQNLTNARETIREFQTKASYIPDVGVKIDCARREGGECAVPPRVWSVPDIPLPPGVVDPIKQSGSGQKVPSAPNAIVDRPLGGRPLPRRVNFDQDFPSLD